MIANKVAVIKQNAIGEEVWRYDGMILKQKPDRVLLEAYFNRSDFPFHGILLKHYDRFLELYFNNRWYNIFQIHDRDDDSLKGWYCNVTLPAEMEDNRITYVDLALDLLVYPDGSQLVLDEDEFEVLDIPSEQKNLALQALEELKSVFHSQIDENLTVFTIFDHGR